MMMKERESTLVTQSVEKEKQQLSTNDDEKDDITTSDVIVNMNTDIEELARQTMRELVNVMTTNHNLKNN